MSEKQIKDTGPDDRVNSMQSPQGLLRAPYFAAGALVVFAAALFVFRELAPLFQQVLMAVFVAYLIYPVHHFFIRRHVPVWASYTLIALAIAVAFTLSGWAVYDNLRSLTSNLPRYRQQFDSFVENVADVLLGVTDNDLKKALEQIDVMGSGMQLATLTVGSILGVFSHLTMVAVFVIMLLIDKESLRERVKKGVDGDNAAEILDGAERINQAVGKYVQVTTVCNLAIGVFTTVLLLIFGVDGPFAWGFLAFLLPYIPYVGPFVAATLPGLFAIISLHNPWYGVLILVLLHISHFAVGNLLEPLLLGRGLHISPLMVIVSLVFWGLLWGITGMVLSVPLLVATKVLLESIPETKSLAVIMSASAKPER